MDVSRYVFAENVRVVFVLKYLLKIFIGMIRFQFGFSEFSESAFLTAVIYLLIYKHNPKFLLQYF